ncbi:Fic/DOC family N-terminal domain-containing protein [Citricoccus nitrophenolicus]|uniref:Fic/DOC family N-terminal domain-containing protein n=1 Tax=Citricoccus nitrophenolicus TaxID=863575 RepID=A0ABV0IKH8_9MICC
MDLTLFDDNATGDLISITGSDPRHGSWEHKAFLPAALPDAMPQLSAETVMTLADARSALSALDNTARHLPNPQLLRQPTLRAEAQSTSALEGTYAPLSEVITADVNHAGSAEMREVLNYVQMANFGFAAAAEGRTLTKSLLTQLQGLLMTGTPLESESGQLRQNQVVIGLRKDGADHVLPVKAARFVPLPPGDQLESGVDHLMEWKSRDHRKLIDPLIKTGIAHYQFETLHPFRDGNGRLGRYLIVHDLVSSGLLSEPTLTVSPWFEARRSQYYDHLLGVSTSGDWDSFLNFFARGLEQAAISTHRQLLELSRVQAELKHTIRSSHIRSESSHALVDLATGRLTFTAPMAAEELGLSRGGARKSIDQLVELGILGVLDPESTYRRRFYAPAIVNVLLGTEV